jgi:CubicO group peptidase (beta-lactamase class C family)
MPTSLETTTPAVGRRTLLKGLTLGGAAAAVTGLASGAHLPAAAAPATSPPADPSAAPEPTGAITAAGVERGLAALPDIIDKDMAQTGVPGLAVVVVYQGEIRYLEGFGVRQVGRADEVDADTVFQLASVSKPISSTVVAAAFTKKLSKIGWDDPIKTSLRDFTLADPWVGRHVTVADMFAHRSGLPDHSGNLLEDVGYGRDEILARHKFYPLRRFRDNYEYTNYGLTAGAEAVARATGRSWEDLAQEVVFKPLGMKSSSYTFADLRRRSNRAALHKKVNGEWVPNRSADYDAQAPAGSASSSVRDMATWLTMLLAEGKPIIDSEQLQRVWLPAIVKPELPAIGAAASFYGLGWNVNYEPTGELRVSHSGAFAQGAATAITLYPSEGLAIAVLTNSSPLAVPEAISAEFADIVRYGKSTQEDWLALIAPFFASPDTADQKKYSTPAANPAPAKPLRAYTGTYRSRLFGKAIVSARGGGLSLTVGPRGLTFRLRHYSGDDFYFQTVGEDESGLSGAVFDGSRGLMRSLTINAWDAHGLGTFVRV